jgi:hypothetical protein
MSLRLSSTLVYILTSSPPSADSWFLEGCAATNPGLVSGDGELVEVAVGGFPVESGVMRELIGEVDLSLRPILSCDADLEDTAEVQESNLKILAEAKASLSDWSVSLLASSLVCSSSKLVTHSLTVECHWPWGPSR